MTSQRGRSVGFDACWMPDHSYCWELVISHSTMFFIGFANTLPRVCCVQLNLYDRPHLSKCYDDVAEKRLKPTIRSLKLSLTARNYTVHDFTQDSTSAITHVVGVMGINGHNFVVELRVVASTNLGTNEVK